MSEKCEGRMCKDKPEADRHEALPLHSCPYNYDVNNDPTPCCTCCDVCQAECADDI
jgi:hypothetical protein